jgi:DinB family protein
MTNSSAFRLDEAIPILERTPAALDALLRGLPDTWTHRNEGGTTWNAFDIVGHLIFADRTDWLPRLHRILENGETRPFDPFDRHGQVKASAGKSLDQLLDEFSVVRRESVLELRSLNLQPADMERRGQHPALGPVTASELLSTWAAHDLNHLHQLSRVMAHQYRDLVGPFAAYLGVMHCEGHSAA